MWGGIIGLIIQLISGAVGGNIAGAAMKQYNLGTIGNSIAGLIGGGVGAQIIGALVGGGTGSDLAGAGGGLDIGVSRWLAWRVTGDYYNTHYQATNQNFNEITNSNGRISTGPVLRF